MGYGWGFIRQMNDAIKNNRRLLGKRKTFRDQRKADSEKQLSNYEHSSLDVVERRMDWRNEEIASRRRRSKFNSLMILLLLPICLVLIGWKVYDGLTEHQQKMDAISPFKEKIEVNAEGVTEKLDYFWGGPLAARTELKQGIRHGKSESFYPTGELFRNAQYEEGELILELYYFKSGDPIAGFPRITDKRTYRLEFANDQVQMSFRFYDGKIIAENYRENQVKNEVLK